MLLKHGITEQQWRVLRVVQEAGEIDAGELAKNACILGPSLSRIIRTLTAKKYIVLRRDPKDGRRALLSLTGKAEAFIREIAPESAEIYAEIEQRVGRDRVENLLGDINKLLSALAPQEKP